MFAMPSFFDNVPERGHDSGPDLAILRGVCLGLCNAVGMLDLDLRDVGLRFVGIRLVDFRL